MRQNTKNDLDNKVKTIYFNDIWKDLTLKRQKQRSHRMFVTSPIETIIYRQLFAIKLNCLTFFNFILTWNINQTKNGRKNYRKLDRFDLSHQGRIVCQLKPVRMSKIVRFSKFGTRTWSLLIFGKVFCQGSRTGSEWNSFCSKHLAF